MSDKIAIKSIVIKVGDKELTFSVEDAKELKEALVALFGKEIIKEVRDHWYYQAPRYGDNNSWTYVQASGVTNGTISTVNPNGVTTTANATAYGFSTSDNILTVSPLMGGNQNANSKT